MKEIFFLALVLISCKSARNGLSDNQGIEKSIKYLTKSWDNEIYTTFKKENLEKTENILKFNNEIIYIEKNDYEYFYEIFDKNYLIISTKKKSNWSWSSPETVTKDSIYIFNLINKKKSFVSLKKTNFARKVSDLKNLYHYSRETIINDEYTYHYAIDSINTDKDELFLVLPNLSVKKYHLIKID
jgi:hypothetical protein